jgi:DNA-binding protein H-NS
MLAELIAQRDALDSQIKQIQVKERKEHINAVRHVMDFYGITVDDLQAKPKTKVRVKYMLDGNTWTGRGKQPAWVRDAVAAGRSLESLLV